MSKTQLNCKPGDRAIVEKPGNPGHGRSLTVLYRAPVDRFCLPDGQWADGAGEECPKWVVELDFPTTARVTQPWGEITTRAASFGVVPDALLRPVVAKEAA
ncbi:hypothetical protein [Delftia acidovorans]|uniref:hypothetical protein n=1 Tax=Delftia acidovorans TaxID=80866 RepID=UPI002FDCDF22